MKITKRQLRRIIKEEKIRLLELDARDLWNAFHTTSTDTPEPSADDVTQLDQLLQSLDDVTRQYRDIEFTGFKDHEFLSAIENKVLGLADDFRAVKLAIQDKVIK